MGKNQGSGKELKAAVILGSRSDTPYVEGCLELLRNFGIEAEMKILSAHRNPEEVAQYAAGAEDAGIGVIIAAAGMSAHLPGAVAARTALPVIGVPIPSSDLQGLDALLSIVQMPSGVPVATMAVGKAGAKNAAVLAAQILALGNEGVREKLIAYRRALAG
jgi:phosphoribosylaminoimidazole carboxylase PurE protein